MWGSLPTRAQPTSRREPAEGLLCARMDRDEGRCATCLEHALGASGSCTVLSCHELAVASTSVASSPHARPEADQQAWNQSTSVSGKPVRDHAGAAMQGSMGTRACWLAVADVV